MDKLYIFYRPYPIIFLFIQFTYYIRGKKNKNNPLHLIINDYRLNNIIILIHYPTPLIKKLQNRLVKIKYFIKINLKLGFYFLRMAEGEK